jgi:hypothetical protein
MPDYGHDVRFGTFLTTHARRPRDVVALAQLSERSGLELVTFQDHPYQPALLDTWTLLSYVAARTDRIHLALDVLNLSLRPPAVVARTAARLDLLTSGRVGLGIGAGWFWDGIEAMGGPRRTPKESVDALDEAIDERRRDRPRRRRALDSIEVLDAHSEKIRVGSGARWGDVVEVLQPLGLGMSSGDHGDVGVGCLATTGGIGFLGRRHGLTIDRVTAAELVLADGRQVRADADTNPDLLWAVRGASTYFGIVTALELDAYPVGDVVLSIMTFDARGSAALLERWGAVVEAAPRELTSFLTFSPQQRVAQLQTVVATDDLELATRALTPLLDGGPLLDQHAQVLPYAAVLPSYGEVHRGGSADPAFRNGLSEHLTTEVAAAVAALAASGEAAMIQSRQVGGAINDVDPMATAYTHRTQRFCVAAVGYSLGALHQQWDANVRPLMDGLYLSFDTQHSFT